MERQRGIALWAFQATIDLHLDQDFRRSQTTGLGAQLPFAFLAARNRDCEEIWKGLAGWIFDGSTLPVAKFGNGSFNAEFLARNAHRVRLLANAKALF